MPTIDLDADDLKSATITLRVPRKGCVCGGTCYQEQEMPLGTLLRLLTEQAALRVVAIQTEEEQKTNQPIDG